MSFGVRLLPPLPLLKNDVVMYIWVAQTIRTRNILKTFIHVCELAVSWVTVQKGNTVVSISFIPLIICLLLTIVVNLLRFDLWCYVHRDFVQLKLKVLNLSTDFIDRACCCFVLVVLICLGNQEVDFLRFTVKLLPAEYEFFLGSGFKFHLSWSIAFNPFLLFLALVSLKIKHRWVSVP